MADTYAAMTVLRRLSVPWDDAVTSATEALREVAEWYFDNGWTPDDFLDACRDAFTSVSS